jgi:hypothetical protein
MGSSTPELAAGAVESDPWTGAYGRALLCIAAIGVVLRLLYVLVVAPELSGGGDWRFFHATAGALADGHGYRIARPLLDRDGSRSDALYPTALHPPAYSFALALWSRWTGDDERSQRLFGIACGLATIVAVAAVGRRVAGATTGLVAAALRRDEPARHRRGRRVAQRDALHRRGRARAARRPRAPRARGSRDARPCSACSSASPH